jgi:ubiquinone/menaquinone biosynthesis C-methylase UbiE
MSLSHDHDMAVSLNQQDRSRRAFVSTLRSHVLQRMSGELRQHFEGSVEPEHAKFGNPLETPEAIHEALKGEFPFKAYSSVRTAAQEMVFDVVSDAVDRQLEVLNEKAAKPAKHGTLTLNPSLQLPKNVTGIDVHLSPGSYHAEHAEDDVTAGAVYDNSIDVFAFGQFGKRHNDIGTTLSNYLRLKYPDFAPSAILDCGCTIGHNTLPWAETFPSAEVTAIDVAAPVLRYAHARAESMGVGAHFKQMDATAMEFDDAQFDVVFSSMFMHELPLKHLQHYLKEAYRVLKPGGILWQMELPPMNAMPSYENFYMNWDTFYNNEPYYGTFRKQDYKQLLIDAGFNAGDFVEATMPRYTFIGESAFSEAIQGGNTFDTLTGRMDPKGTRWYGFGAWKN